MLLMEYLTIRWEDLPDYSNKATWNLLHEYIDANCQRLIYKCLGYGVQAISIFQSQCANTKCSDQSRYNRVFQKIVHRQLVQVQVPRYHGEIWRGIQVPMNPLQVLEETPDGSAVQEVVHRTLPWRERRDAGGPTAAHDIQCGGVCSGPQLGRL